MAIPSESDSLRHGFANAHNTLVALGETLKHEFQSLIEKYTTGWFADDYLTAADLEELYTIELEVDRGSQVCAEFLQLERSLTSGFIPAQLAVCDRNAQAEEPEQKAAESSWFSRVRGDGETGLGAIPTVTEKFDSAVQPDPTVQTQSSPAFFEQKGQAQSNPHREDPRLGLSNRLNQSIRKTETTDAKPTLTPRSAVSSSAARLPLAPPKGRSPQTSHPPIQGLQELARFLESEHEPLVTSTQENLPELAIRQQTSHLAQTRDESRETRQVNEAAVDSPARSSARLPLAPPFGRLPLAPPFGRLPLAPPFGRSLLESPRPVMGLQQLASFLASEHSEGSTLLPEEVLPQQKARATDELQVSSGSNRLSNEVPVKRQTAGRKSSEIGIASVEDKSSPHREDRVLPSKEEAELMRPLSWDNVSDRQNVSFDNSVQDQGLPTNSQIFEPGSVSPERLFSLPLSATEEAEAIESSPPRPQPRDRQRGEVETGTQQERKVQQGRMLRRQEATALDTGDTFLGSADHANTTGQSTSASPPTWLGNEYAHYQSVKAVSSDRASVGDLDQMVVQPSTFAFPPSPHPTAQPNPTQYEFPGEAASAPPLHPDEVTDIDLDRVLEAIADEVSREYKRFYGD